MSGWRGRENARSVFTPDFLIYDLGVGAECLLTSLEIRDQFSKRSQEAEVKKEGEEDAVVLIT